MATDRGGAALFKRTLSRAKLIQMLELQWVEGEDVHDLRVLLTARRALVKDQVTAKMWLATALNPRVREQPSRRIVAYRPDHLLRSPGEASRSGLAD